MYDDNTEIQLSPNNAWDFLVVVMQILNFYDNIYWCECHDDCQSNPPTPFFSSHGYNSKV